SIHDLYVSMWLSYDFSPQTIEEGNSPAALQMIAMGLGVTLITESAQDARLPGMVFRPLTKPTPAVDLCVAYRRDNRSAALQAFLETVRAVLPTVRAH